MNVRETLVAQIETVEKELALLKQALVAIDAIFNPKSTALVVVEKSKPRTVKVTKSDVIDVLRNAQRTVTPAFIARELRAKGLKVAPRSIPNHLNRLFSSGEIIQINGRYKVPK